MFRGISKRKVALLIFGPMLFETLGMMFMTWMLSHAAQTHDADVQPFIAAAGSFAYCVFANIASRVATPRNAPWLLTGAIFVIFGAGAAAILTNVFWMFVLATATMGACAG
ncbi:MAG: hypothetical protein ACYTGQ_06570, partial [Planctomycetota bacterium]